MKLAFALFEYFPYGGLQRDMLAIASAALARGHQVTVYTRQWQGATPQGPKVVTLPVDARSNHARDAGFAGALAPRLAGFDSVVGFNTYGEQFNGMHINQTMTGVAIGRKQRARQ